ncbi:hypothetical protein T265_15732, partial [Opisthorchis viverrini]
KCLPSLRKFWGKARALPPFVLPNHNGEYFQNITGLQVTNPTFSTQVQMSWRSIIDSSPSGILKSDSNRSINARTSALATRLSQLDFESDTTRRHPRLNQVLWAFEWDKHVPLVSVYLESAKHITNSHMVDLRIASFLLPKSF